MNSINKSSKPSYEKFQALYNLTPVHPSRMVEVVLPHLTSNLNTIDVNSRHGIVLAIAEILEALHNNFHEKIEKIVGKLCPKSSSFDSRKAAS